MMHDQKKIAMLIVRGLADFNKDKEYDPTKDQAMKTPDEHKESDDHRVGPELAMQKFIDAVHDKDCKKACKAMREFQEMSEGTEYFDSAPEDSMHGDD